jgi:Universal stress protein UspA and related nucleotide-binding proteins
MNHVLLAIDADDGRAVEQAEAVQDLFDAESTTAHLLHVFTDNPQGASVRQLGSVRRAAEVLEDAGTDLQYHEQSGDPPASIMETAVEIDADAICIAGRNRSPTGKALFGSVSQQVILGTDRPVIVCGPARETE